MCFPFNSGESIDPPNDQARDLVGKLKIMFYIQIGLIVMEIFLLFSGVPSSTFILEMFSCCILYMAYTQVNFCSCAIYIFFCMFSIVHYIVFFGTCIQNKTDVFAENSKITFYVILVSFATIFYIVAIYFSFQAYKEFKALAQEGLLVPNNPAHEDSSENGYDPYGNQNYNQGYPVNNYNNPPPDYNVYGMQQPQPQSQPQPQVQPQQYPNAPPPPPSPQANSSNVNAGEETHLFFYFSQIINYPKTF